MVNLEYVFLIFQFSFFVRMATPDFVEHFLRYADPANKLSSPLPIQNLSTTPALPPGEPPGLPQGAPRGRDEGVPSGVPQETPLKFKTAISLQSGP